MALKHGGRGVELPLFFCTAAMIHVLEDACNVIKIFFEVMNYVFLQGGKVAKTFVVENTILYVPTVAKS
jgi:hypothetical protein